MKTLRVLGLLLMLVVGSSIWAQSDGKAKVYIIRNTPANGFSPAPILINGNEVGVTMGMTYLEKEVDPGSITISGRGGGRSVTIAVEAGKTYYIQQKVVPVMLGVVSKFNEFKPGKGEKALPKCAPARGPAGVVR